LHQEIGNLLPNNRRQRRTCYALCHILYPVSAALTSIFRMHSSSTSYALHQTFTKKALRAAFYQLLLVRTVTFFGSRHPAPLRDSHTLHCHRQCRGEDLQAEPRGGSSGRCCGCRPGRRRNAAEKEKHARPRGVGIFSWARYPYTLVIAGVPRSHENVPP
jgi:hypothetical protein